MIEYVSSADCNINSGAGLAFLANEICPHGSTYVISKNKNITYGKWALTNKKPPEKIKGTRAKTPTPIRHRRVR